MNDGGKQVTRRLKNQALTAAAIDRDPEKVGQVLDILSPDPKDPESIRAMVFWRTDGK